jgi:AraC family transcriptional regulator of adaptative response / DNA-3-methyladenine glycosylase II
MLEAEPLLRRLPYRGPLAGRPLLDWLGTRALAGVERVEDGRYRRTLRLPHGTGAVELRLDGGAPGQVVARLWLGDRRDVGAALRRCRELLDLDADPAAIEAVLRPDPLLGPLVAARPGLRVPGCADGFELAARAVLGQQVSVAAARTFGGRLVAGLGEPLDAPLGGLTHLFPAPRAVAGAGLRSLGLTARRAATLRALAAAVADGRLALDRGGDREATAARLLALPGIGPWTAAYVAMRALGDPDAFPATDLGLRAAARRLGAAGDPRSLRELARRWRPWRAYGAMHLWASLDDRPGSHGAGPRP